MSRTRQSKLRRARAESRMKLYAGLAAAALAIVPSVSVLAQTGGATGVSGDSTAPASGATAGASTGTNGSSANSSATTGTGTTATGADTTGAGTTGAGASATAGTDTTNGGGASANGSVTGSTGATGSTTMGTTGTTTDNTGATGSVGANASATTSTDQTGTNASAGATTGTMGTSGTGMSNAPGTMSGTSTGASTYGGATGANGSMSGSMNGSGMSMTPATSGGTIDYTVLADRNLSYFDIKRAQAYGLTIDQIAEAYGLAHDTGFPMQLVLDRVESGYTFPYLAQMWGVPLQEVYSPEKYRDRINDYIAAYQATGLHGLQSGGTMMGSGGMSMSDNSMTNGTGAPGGYTSASASVTPMTSGSSTTMGTTGAMGTTGTSSMNTGSQTITDVIRSDGRFTQLASALTAAGLDSYLRGPGQFTLFAPTDAAFAKLPQDQLNALMQNPAQLSKVLQYHLVGRRIGAGDIASMSSPSVATIEGDPLTVSSNAGAINVNGANVTQSQIPASNGVIYAVDTVLMPPSAGGTGAGAAGMNTSAGASATTGTAGASATGTTGSGTTTAPNDANGSTNSGTSVGGSSTTSTGAPVAPIPSGNNPAQASGATAPEGSANTQSGTGTQPGTAGGNTGGATANDPAGTANPTP